MKKYWVNLATGLKAVGAMRLVTILAFFPLWALTYLHQSWPSFILMLASFGTSSYVIFGVLREWRKSK